MPVLIHVLALAVFAQGTSEFMLAGLLVDLSTDLTITPAAAGSLTSAYAAGMVLGAPTMAAAAARLRPRPALVAFLTLFVAAHVAGAATGSFAVLFATRVVAALANAGFLAVALGAVGRVVPPRLTTRAVAVLLSGITVATVVGAPAGAVVAQALGWRATFWAVAALCVPAMVALALQRSLDAAGEPCRFDPRAELRVLRHGPVATAVALAVGVNGATFGVLTYLAVIGANAGIVGLGAPLLLAAFGAGAFVGVNATGRWAPGRERWWILAGCAALPAVWAGFALVAALPWAVAAAAVVAGAVSFAVGSSLVARIVRESAAAPVLGGSYATAALNLGAFAGPFVAGVALAAAGATAVLWYAVAVTGGTFLLAVATLRRRRSNGIVTIS
ncbi:MFS transporter [Isoptericola sp. BMS4]|uniref:MFS transporter n=1 Tax=Isoptericola sp. BMS4 TaxID=2527875 RepID=UPI00142232A4|nr:MFS transporter [Isoptericola sp. BMS4]